MSLVRPDRPMFTLAADSKEVFDVTGAGDTVCGVLAAAISGGCDIESAMSLANKAAGIVVGKFGTATVSVRELGVISQIENEKSFNVENLLELVKRHRVRGARIVMTNGCFDILHAGHVDYLQRAKALGDILIVAVNSDASVRQLKGASRPINKLNDRLKVLAALESVDALITFDQLTPIDVIKALQPDVLVKGGDYRPDEIVGANVVLAKGGDVKVLPFVEGLSSSVIIGKLEGDQ